MSEDITLTVDEAAALREVLVALSVIEERGLNFNHTIEVSRELWRDMLLRPAQRLRRVASAKRVDSGERRYGEAT